MVTPQYVALGLHDDMVAEYGAFDFKAIGVKSRDCKWTILPIGDAQWDTEYAASRKAALSIAQEIAQFHGIKIVYC